MISPDLGRLALSAALVFTALQMLASGVGAVRGSARAILIAQRAALAAVISLALAFGVLLIAFLGSDFSVALVVANSHIDKPLGYKIAGVWGNHEGSMLLWCGVLAGAAAMLARSAALAPDLRARAGVVLAGVSLCFLAFSLFASDPFLRLSPAPWGGQGLNPLLQDPALAVHPPMLYFGYVGLAAPFAIAVGALWGDAPAKVWARAMRPWVLGAFSFLTAGIALGSYWAYYELGWGGWWFWDPVENASLMPWLFAAALLHSTLVTAHRGALAPWTLLLAILAFTFSMMGAFLVRSGVLTSVHAFALDPERGVLLLLIMTLVAGGALTLFAARAPRLGLDGRDFDVVSREMLLVANNVFLVASAAVILLGTLFPIISEAVTGRAASVGAPYFDRAAAPLIGAPLVLAPIATLLAWRRGRLSSAVRALGPAIAAALGAGVGLLALTRGGAVGAAVAAALGAWMIAGAVSEVLVRAARGGAGGVWARLMREPLRRWGGPLAHAGVGLLALGAAADTAFPIERVTLLAPGEAVEVVGRTVRLEGLEAVEGANYVADRAIVTVAWADRVLRLTPERRYYPVADQSTSEVALRRSASGDLYVALGPPQARADGATAWTLRIMINPLIWMLYAGAALIAFGGLLAMRPARPRPAPDAPEEAVRRLGEAQ